MRAGDRACRWRALAACSTSNGPKVPGNVTLQKALDDYHAGNIDAREERVRAGREDGSERTSTAGTTSASSRSTRATPATPAPTTRRRSTIDPNFESALYNYGVLQLRQPTTSTRRSPTSTQAVAQNPKDANAHWNLGLALAKRGQRPADNKRSTKELNAGAEDRPDADARALEPVADSAPPAHDAGRDHDDVRAVTGVALRRSPWSTSSMPSRPTPYARGTRTEPADAARARIDPREWRPREWQRYAPLLLVAFAVGFGVWLLRAELHAVPYPNDASTCTSRSCASPSSGSGPGTARSTRGIRISGSARRSSCSTRRLSHILTGLLSIVFGDVDVPLGQLPAHVHVADHGLHRGPALRISTVAGRRRGAVLADARQRRRATASSGRASPGSAAACGRCCGRSGCCRSRWVSRGARSRRASGTRSATFAVGLTCALHFVTGYLVLAVHRRVRAGAPARRAEADRARRADGVRRTVDVRVRLRADDRAASGYVTVDSFQVGTFWVDSYGPEQGVHVVVPRSGLRLRAPSRGEPGSSRSACWCASSGRSATRRRGCRSA